MLRYLNFMSSFKLPVVQNTFVDDDYTQMIAGKFWCIYLKYCFSYSIFTLLAPTPQNAQTHSNNLSAKSGKLFECVWPFGVADPQRVKILKHAIFISRVCFFQTEIFNFLTPKSSHFITKNIRVLDFPDHPGPRTSALTPRPSTPNLKKRITLILMSVLLISLS